MGEVLPDRAERGIRPSAHDGHGDRRIIDHVDAEMDTKRVNAAVEGFGQYLSGMQEVLFPEGLPRKQQRELIAAKASAEAAGPIRDPFQHGGGLDEDLIALQDAEQRVDQMEMQDIAGDHDPFHLRAVHDQLARELIEGVGVQRVRKAVMLGEVARGSAAVVLGLPVVGGGRTLMPDLHQLHNGAVQASVREPECDRIRFDMEDAVLEMLVLFLVDAGPAGLRAGAVGAFLIRVPNAVAAFVQADLSILLKLQDAALDGIDHPREVILPGHLRQIGAHLIDRILAVPGLLRLRLLRHLRELLLVALRLVHFLVGDGNELSEPFGIRQHRMDIADGEIQALVAVLHRP